MAFIKNEFNSENENKYTSKECEEFVENYCKEHGITSEELAMDGDHFDIVMSMFEEFLKNK